MFYIEHFSSHGQQTVTRAKTADRIEAAALRACGFHDGPNWSIQWENQRRPVELHTDRVIPGAYTGMAIRSNRYGNHVEGRIHVTIRGR